MIPYLLWLVLIRNFRTCMTAPDVPLSPDAPPRCHDYDLDLDGDVDLYDLFLMHGLDEYRACSRVQELKGSSVAPRLPR